MTDLVGKLLNNRYQITGLLGEGGMGGVYKAHDETLKRDVAIKVMKANLAHNDEFQKRFLQEAQTAARLDHSGIVRAYDFGEVNNMNFIVMEFILGDNLKEMIQALRSQQQWIKLTEAIELVRKIAEALEYAHRNGVLHRDIKPANIMIRADMGEDKSYQPVVTDLGLAKLDTGAMDTQVGSTMGTPPYMSPEQALGEEVDQRSDIYSLGILFYELAVGQLPFQVASISQAIKYHVRTPPPPPSRNRPDLPPEVESVILRALVKEPQGRYQTMAQFAKALQNLSTEGMPQTVPPGATGGASSLMTKYQESVVNLRSQLSMVPSAHQGHTRIRIRDQEGVEHTVPFRTARMVIGRQSGVDIVLRNEKVSRRHATIEYDGEHYWVTDLGSSNGVFIGKLRLRPKTKARWDLSKPLQVGKHDLILEPGHLGIGPVSGPPVEEPEQRGIDIALASSQLNVTPGNNTLLKLRLTNKGRSPETVAISVEKVPRNWITTNLPVVQLAPGARQELSISINLPRTSKVKGGVYPILVRGITQTEPRQVAISETQLVVQEITKFAGELLTSEQRIETPVELIINNQGTALGDYQIDWNEPSGRLTFSPEKNFLRVPPGKMTSFKCKVDEKPRLVGRAKRYTISAQIKDRTGEQQRVDAELVSKPTIPPWLSILPLALLVVAVGFFWQSFGPGGTQPPKEPTRTMGEIVYTLLPFLATPTPTLTSTPDAPATSTQEALVADQTAAAESALAAEGTATAVWLIGDDDGDGLTNEREIAMNLRPDNVDSDADNLNDGDEVEKYKTDPLNSDSDKDDLPDGVEIERGSNPLSDDTDKDGTPDAADSAPLATPTPTFTPTPTTDLTATAVSGNATAEFIVSQTRTAQFATAAADEMARQQAEATRSAQATADEVARLQQTAAAATRSAQATADELARAQQAAAAATQNAQATADEAARLQQAAAAAAQRNGQATADELARQQAAAAAAATQSGLDALDQANRATAQALSATQTALARPQPPTITPTPTRGQVIEPPSHSQPSDNGPVTEALRSKIRSSGVNNDYRREAELLAGHLVARLSDFPDGGADMRNLLSRADAGDRVNAIVHRVWKDWKQFKFDHMSENPANHRQTSFRQLAIRLVQGRQGTLSSADRRALESWFSRSDNWHGDMRGVIGSINGEIYGE